MFRGDGIGERHRVVERFDENDSAKIIPRGARDFRTRKRRKLRFNSALDFICERLIVSNENRLRVDVVLGLRQQIGRDPVGVGATIRDHQHLGWTGDHVDADLAEHQALRGGHISVAGADDLRHRLDGRGAIGQRRHRLCAADAVDFGHAAQLRRRQHQRIELAVG